ncbi:hypothetical protein JYU34_006552 [Plutella xylostella]|uniref:Uncharacterized protein n=1 Tax=Plutella xylostella TaxID=51655 RepID=A0ABQ7QS99_PLUXY|nr:hypothetical protein JYU34_006552 [Plutella xylostella]
MTSSSPPLTALTVNAPAASASVSAPLWPTPAVSSSTSPPSRCTRPTTPLSWTTTSL